MVRGASEEVDVVVVALQADMSYLSSWVALLKGCHLIVVQGADFAGTIRLPEGFDDVEVHTRSDMEERLGGELARAVGFTGVNSRGFGYLVARRRYVVTMEAGCGPEVDPEGFVVNPVTVHVRNLTTPATPFFFNTLYDPFRPGADFVRGYPFSLREGVPTVVSQGLWTSGKSKRYVDAVLTVPRFALFTASGVNLAFDRRRVGLLMYEPPQLGSEAQELWAGLCAKAICDHTPWGVKSGLPYVRRSDSPPVAEQSQNETDRFDLIADFFHNTKLSGNPLDVEGCYLELAQQAQSKLAAVDPVFKDVASSMQAWIRAWKKLSDVADQV